METIRETDRYSLERQNLHGVYVVTDCATGDTSLWLTGMDGEEEAQNAAQMHDVEFESWAEEKIELGQLDFAI